MKPDEAKKDGADAGGLTGTWKLAPVHPAAHGHAFESTLTLKQAGKTLSGRLASEMGEGELSGTVEDAAVQFAIVAQFQGQKFEFKFKGSVAGDRLTGTLETPFGQPIEVEATRAPHGACRRRRDESAHGSLALSPRASRGPVGGGAPGDFETEAARKPALHGAGRSSSGTRRR